MKLFLPIVFLVLTISMTQAANLTKFLKAIFPCIRCMAFNCFLPAVDCAMDYYKDRELQKAFACLADKCVNEQAAACVGKCLFKENPFLRGKQMDPIKIYHYANHI